MVWRWNGPFQIKAARFGFCFWIKGHLLTTKPRASPPQDPHTLAQCAKKLLKVVNRQSLTNWFPVPKGLKDIRMVYDGTKSGLNAALWAPNFFMPNAETALQKVDFGFYAVDVNLGEFFLNFPML